jgi:hypothetical protein
MVPLEVILILSIRGIVFELFLSSLPFESGFVSLRLLEISLEWPQSVLSSSKFQSRAERCAREL